MKCVVLGAGESGVGAAILSQKEGFSTFVSEYGSIKESYRLELEQRGIAFEEGRHTLSMLSDADTVVKSPGIPDTAPIVISLIECGVEVISEIEFASRYFKGKSIAITGSNGKTTTTSIVGHLLEGAGVNLFVGGNIGNSFARAVAEDRFDWAVLELSSFQLDGVYSFKADIAVLLNITPDHLDRYDYNMDNYIDSKFRVSNNQAESDIFIYSIDDKVLSEEVPKRDIEANILRYSIDKSVNYGGYLDDKYIVINCSRGVFKLDVNLLSIKGLHNISNSIAAVITALEVGVNFESIVESLPLFKGIEHRLESVGTIGGVEYINDSKATNVDAVYSALDSMVKPTIWIVGGVDKGNDYSQLDRLVEREVKGVICLGVDNSKIIDYISPFGIPYVECSSMDLVVRESSLLAESGDVVLLSPACASFDLFSSYIDRGDKFRESVLKNMV